jgi:hypothetical protein
MLNDFEILVIPKEAFRSIYQIDRWIIGDYDKIIL